MPGPGYLAHSACSAHTAYSTRRGKVSPQCDTNSASSSSNYNDNDDIGSSRNDSLTTLCVNLKLSGSDRMGACRRFLVSAQAANGKQQHSNSCCCCGQWAKVKKSARNSNIGKRKLQNVAEANWKRRWRRVPDAYVSNGYANLQCDKLNNYASESSEEKCRIIMHDRCISLSVPK